MQFHQLHITYFWVLELYLILTLIYLVFLCYGTFSIIDILLESPSSKEILSSVTIASLDETKDTRNDILDLPQVRCTKPQDETEGLFPNCVEVPVIEVDSVDPKQHFEQWSNRFVSNICLS